MSTRSIYTLPTEQTGWALHGNTTVQFAWEYGEARERLLTLYGKGKTKQWDANFRIDWSQEVDPENPLQLPDATTGVYGTPTWERMTEKERTELRIHGQAWRISQFLHGEQGALICASRIVETVPDLDSKFYAATQVIDEARHVEVYSRYLHEKIELAYPINKQLQLLLEQTLTDSRWDFVYLGMQVLIEGLALAAFGVIRDTTTDALAKAIHTYVMEDEARHVAFGRIALRDFYPQLTASERKEREEFVVEACHLMNERLVPTEVYERLGLPKNEYKAFLAGASSLAQLRRFLFMRIVPTIKDIGLWGAPVQRAYEQMGVLDFANVDVGGLLDADVAAAEQMDARRLQVASTIAAAGQN